MQAGAAPLPDAPELGAPIPCPPRAGGPRGLSRTVLLHVLFQAGLAGLTLATALALTGSRVWFPALLAEVRPQLALVALAVVVLAAALRRWPAVGLAVLLVVADGAPVVRLLRGPATPAAGPDRLVVEHLNTHTRASVARLRAYLAATDADAVVLLHVERPVGAAFVDDPSPFGAVAFDPGTGGDGVLGLARSDFASARAVSLRGHAAVALVVPLGNRRVTVLGAHPSAPTDPHAMRSRDETLAAMATFAQRAADPVVLVGDLNTTPWSPAFRALRRAARLRDASSGRGWHPTYPSWLGPLGVPIDHALHSADLVTVAVSRRSGLGSPHRRLRVELAWSATPAR